MVSYLKAVALACVLFISSLGSAQDDELRRKANLIEKQAEADQRAITGGKPLQAMPFEAGSSKPLGPNGPTVNGDCTYEKQPRYVMSKRLCEFEVSCELPGRMHTYVVGTCKPNQDNKCTRTANECFYKYLVGKPTITGNGDLYAPTSLTTLPPIERPRLGQGRN